MALLGNYNVFTKNPATYIGGTQLSNVRSAFNMEGQMLQMYYGESEGGGLPLTASLDTGTEPPYSWHLAEKGGEMSSTTMTNGTATLTASQQNGINIVSTIAGIGTIDTAGLSLVTSMIALIEGLGELTGSMVGTIQMASTLAGSGDLTGSLGMLSGMFANLSGSGSLSADLKGKLSMAATIYVNEGSATIEQIVNEVVQAIVDMGATGGLTVDEHAQLMKTLTKGQFIALK